MRTFSTSKSGPIRPNSLVTIFLDTRTSSSDCDDSRREPFGFYIYVRLLFCLTRNPKNEIPNDSASIARELVQKPCIPGAE